MDTIQISVDADGIALLTIDMPGRPVNVLNASFLDDLRTAVERVATDPAIRAAVLTSGKDGNFIAGGDIKKMLATMNRGITATESAANCAPTHELLRRIETCGKPFAAAINGLALGGGLEIALACHWRVLSSDPKAQVGLPEVGIGLMPGAGATQRLPRLIGIEKSLGLLLTGKPIGPEEALKLGVVQALAAPDALIAAARTWLRGTPSAVQPWDVKGYRVPGGAGPSAPHAGRSFMAGTAMLAAQTNRNLPGPLALLSAVYEGTQVSIDVGLRIERKYFGLVQSGPVAKNMIRTLFINKREAEKLSNRPADVPKSKVRKLGVLGAGVMGAGVAHAAINAGIDVVLLDTTQEAAEKGKQYSVRVYDKGITRGSMTREKADARLARIHPTTSYADLSDCDFVIEAVFENREVKADVTRKAEAAMPKTAFFGSNTSTLPITGLAKAFSRPQDFIGIHFFSPVERMPLVELIMGQQTSQATLAKALDFVEQIRKTPILVNDSPNFYTSRVFGSFLKEGLAMLREGVAPALIENGARQAGMPIGPLAIADETSLALSLHAHEQRVADGLAPEGEPGFTIDLIKKMVNDYKRPGRRAGGGFYEYPTEGKKHLWAGLAEAFPAAAVQPGVDEVKRRILCIQAMETARCVEQGVIVHPADADVGSVLGIGFPAWTGGTLSFIDMVGIAPFVAECDALANKHGERFRPSPWLRERAAQGASFLPPMAVSD